MQATMESEIMITIFFMLGCAFLISYLLSLDLFWNTVWFKFIGIILMWVILFFASYVLNELKP